MERHGTDTRTEHNQIEMKERIGIKKKKGRIMIGIEMIKKEALKLIGSEDKKR